jgi:LptD protein
VMSDPYFGQAPSITKVNDNYYVLSKGWLSTSDYDNPEWRIKSRKIEIYPGDKAVALNSVMYIGAVPIMYIPRYVQSLKDNGVHLRVIPGHTKEFGYFVLMTSRFNLTNTLDTTYHLDLRERKGVAWGVDLGYHPPTGNQAVLKTYYTHERAIAAKHAWSQKTEPTLVRQRYKIELRDSWQIDPQTSFIGQYYKQTDPDFLKEYFEKDYQNDEVPNTYALLTHNLPNATVSVRTDLRVNRYENAIERKPEINYNLTSQPIADTGFYLKSIDSAVILVQKDPTPSDSNHYTRRIDSYNELSRPFKWAFLEFRPYVGMDQTYYSQTLDPQSNNIMRGQFRTGLDISTKFYRVYDVVYKGYGLNVNRLRHVITPTISYGYQHDPTVSSSKLYAFDGIDSLSRSNLVTLSLENALQTKVKDVSVTLARSLLSMPFRFSDNPSPASWGDATLTNELYPNEYVTFHQDVTYSNDIHHVQTANFDLYLHDNKKWEFDIGERVSHKDSSLLSTQLTYKFNPRWRTVIYSRWDLNTGHWQEQQYSFVRDLHSWEVEFAIRDKKEPVRDGSEFWFIFRLKAFPSFGFNGGSNFTKRRVGQQQVIQ